MLWEAELVISSGIKCKNFFLKELKQKSAQLCGMENEVSAQKRWVM